MLRRLVLLVLPAVILATGAGFRNPASRADDAPQRFVLPDTDDGIPGAGPIRRYDWFRSLWTQRRQDFARQAPDQRSAVVFLGDSITQGWGEDLGGRFGDMKVANRGISGDTTRGMLLRLQDDVLSLKPSGVVLLMGTNDLEEGAQPQVIADNVGLIVQAIGQHNAKIPIILCQVFPSSASKNRPAAAIQQINALTADVVRGNAQVTVLDTWTLFANAEGDAKVEEFPDLLHPNAAGYALWSAALRPVLETLELLPVHKDVFEPEDGFVSLFNGRDLTGWGFQPTTPEMRASRERWQKNNPGAPPWPLVEEAVAFDGRMESSDGRYLARNGRLVVTTPTEGRRIQQLWTTEEFSGDFELKLEFRASPNADSGVFLRGPQLQCRDYLLAGPYKELQGYKPLDWNELVVTVQGDTAVCTCNGEVLEAEFKVPATGAIGLEGDRGQMEYRRIRIRNITGPQ